MIGGCPIWVTCRDRKEPIRDDFSGHFISTEMADTNPIETTSKPKKGKLMVERKMMLRGKDYVGIRLDQTANAEDLNVFRSKRKTRERV